MPGRTSATPSYVKHTESTAGTTVNVDFLRARSHYPISRIQFLLVPKIGWCECSKTDTPTHGSFILKMRMEIEHALFSSDTYLERQNAPTKTEA